MFGGSNDLLGGGGDAFGSMQAAPTFPAYVAFEDDIIGLGFSFKKEMGTNNTHIISAMFKNKSQIPITSVNMQVAAQKYMVLKMQPPVGTGLSPMG